MENENKLYNPLWKPTFNFLFFWGIFITVFGSIGLFNQNTEDLNFRLAVLAVLGIIPLAIGYVGRLMVKKNFKQFDSFRTKKNLRVLIQEKRELSIVDVSQRLNIEIEFAKELLEDLVKVGQAEAFVNDSGIMIYKLKFPDQSY